MLLTYARLRYDYEMMCYDLCYAMLCYNYVMMFYDVH